MMTVKVENSHNPTTPSRSSSSEGILSSLSPGFSPGILAVFGIFITSGISALALLRCLRAPCHLVGLSLLALLAPFAMALSLSIPPAQPNSTGPPHSAQLPRPNSLGPTHSAQLTRPSSLDPTHSAQLPRPNSLGPTHSAQLPRPNSLGPTHSAQLYPLGPTHSAQLTRPNSTRSAQLTQPNSLGPTHSAQLTRPSSLDPLIPTQLDSPGPTHSAPTRPTQLARPNSNPAHLVPLSQPSSLYLPCDQLTGWPTNQPPTLWDHVLPEPSCISLQSTHLNDFVVTGGGVM